MTFNPRSYKRSDTFVKGLKDAIKLSIHAPTRGATNASSTASADSIFQSTFLQEERQFLSFASGSYFYFQSTLLQEERRPTQRGKMRYLYLSIHAPTRGATTKTGHIPVLGNFQSTLLQEERPEDIIGLVCNMWLSIHAPTRGATTTTTIMLSTLSLSIHAPTRGATQTPHAYFTKPNLSIHAPTRGATFCNAQVFCAMFFQSTLLQEERRGKTRIAAGIANLSIHAPTRGATLTDHHHN